LGLDIFGARCNGFNASAVTVFKQYGGLWGQRGFSSVTLADSDKRVWTFKLPHHEQLRSALGESGLIVAAVPSFVLCAIDGPIAEIFESKCLLKGLIVQVTSSRALGRRSGARSSHFRGRVSCSQCARVEEPSFVRAFCFFCSLVLATKWALVRPAKRLPSAGTSTQDPFSSSSRRRCASRGSRLGAKLRPDLTGGC
jgi:hypothetical protein